MAPINVATYLANAILIAQIDGDLTQEQEQALAVIRQKTAADAVQFDAALKRASAVGYVPVPTGRFSEQVSNLEDMLFMALIDGDLTNKEKDAMLAFAKTINLTQTQINTILAETRELIRCLRQKPECSACGTPLAPGTRFCIECGQKV
jgi:tellurite resistance protein